MQKRDTDTPNSINIKEHTSVRLNVCIQKSFHKTMFSCLVIITSYDTFRFIKDIIELRHEISNSVVCAISKTSDQPAHMQPDQSLCWSLRYFITFKLMTEYNLVFLNLQKRLHRLVRVYTCQILHYWKSYVAAQL